MPHPGQCCQRFPLSFPRAGVRRGEAPWAGKRESLSTSLFLEAQEKVAGSFSSHER